LAEPLMATAKAFATDNRDFMETVQAAVTRCPAARTAGCHRTS
jgi:hypothetical protein